MTPEVRAFYDAATSTLTYVVFDAATRDAVVVDPVLDFDPSTLRVRTQSVQRVIEFIEQHSLHLRAVLETHAHADHFSGARTLADHFAGVPVAIGSGIVQVQKTFRPILGLPASFPTNGSQFDRLLDDGARFSAGSLELDVIATPGHTPACSTYRIGNAVFTGDALFLPEAGTGRCDFPGGDAPTLYRSITEKLYALPDTTRVFVGHDYPPENRAVRWETTIGAQKAENIHLPATRSEKEFVNFRTTRDATLAPPRLLYPSLLVNVLGGRLPPPDALGRRFLVLPLFADEAATTEPAPTERESLRSSPSRK